jgi:hypothetical protein
MAEQEKKPGGSDGKGVVHAWVGQKHLNCFIFKRFFSIGHR